MTTRILRKIVKIDEEKCNGCGICVPSCAEGALRIIDGKARLVSEKYCDGLGACLGECPQDAITIVDAEAEEFDEEAAKRHMEHQQQTHTEEKLPCGCPSHSIHQFEKQDTNTCECEVSSRPSALGHFPVKLELVPPEAPFLKGADLLLAADCSAFCYGGFHRDFLKGHALLTACPKLHEFQARVDKLTEILTRSSVKSLKVLRMEVPCCSGLVHMAEKAIEQSGKKIPLEAVTIGIKGDIRD